MNISALNEILFDEERLRGNADDYYDPRNSCVNEVLDRKVGIPITLALVYMEVARRIGFPLFGVGMPGHFLLKHYDPEGRQVLIDAFNCGHILSAKDCQRRLNEIYAGQLTFQPEFLMSVSRRQMLTRILNNLKTIYLSARNFRKALPIVDLVLVIYPRSPEDVKQRALLRYSLGMMRRAVEDLEDYLKMSPDASDAWRVRGMATAEGWRGCGVGARVLAEVIDHVSSHGGGLLWANVRLPAVDFYRRAGFDRRGEPWDDPDIGPHVAMWRRVSA